MSITSPGTSMKGFGENSCSMTSIGKSGARSSGPRGCCVPGCRGGASGSGREGSTFTHALGIWLSASRNFEWDCMGKAYCSNGQGARS
jgi:hypothetical protein